jgi:hypothetical protein
VPTLRRSFQPKRGAKSPCRSIKPVTSNHREACFSRLLR